MLGQHKTILKEKIKLLVGYHNRLLEELYDHEAHDIDEVFNEIVKFEHLYKKYCIDSQDLMHKWISEKKSILFEGAQGTLLDIDHGTYPSYTIDFLPKIKIEIAVADEIVDQVKNAIIKSSASGKIGDGKIFISPIDEVIRIRTGETNEDAL